MNAKKAKELCIEAHKGQFRRDGITPYSSHPIAVAELLKTDEEKQIAYLHDIFEDTHFTAGMLRSLGYSVEVIQAIDALTKRPDECYFSYLRRVSKNKLATKVKIADMFHNISSNPTDKQKEKYFKGIKYLLEVL